MSKQIDKKPYFTIITPTYNVERYLPRMLYSVERQTYKNIEHIFIDGYSTDSTWQLIKAYKRRNPEIRVKAIKRKPQGVFKAQNQGIRKAKGRYVNLLNGDDYLLDKNVLRDVYKTTKDRLDIHWLQGDTVIGKSYPVHIRNRYLVGHIFHFGLSLLCPILPQSTFMTPQLYKKYNYHKTYKRNGMDTDLYLRMSENEKIFFYDRKVAFFTIRPDSVSMTKGPLQSWYSNWVDFYRLYGQVPVISGINRNIKYRNLREFIATP